ncbi:MAG TPA: tetratricopeptide repeat protein [Bryobacteraceae bacterium]
MPRALIALLIGVAPLSLAQRALVLADAPLQPRALVALVIGNGAYRRSPLPNPANDARAMRDVLVDLGFTVELKIDADRKELIASIDLFRKRLRRGDLAVFYYAGHGYQIDGENYLVPTDFEGTDETAAKFDSYPIARLSEGMEKSGAALNIIILDACRNNPFPGARALGGGLAAMSAAAGTFVAFATAPGKTASDNSRGKNGLFTTYLLESLKQSGLTLDDVFNRTREQVYNASKGDQIPWTQSSVIGRFYFRPAMEAATETPAPSRPAPVRPRIDPSYQQGVREARNGAPEHAVDAFTAAIRRNPDNMDAYYERAMTYATADQFHRAIDDFNQILRRSPDDVNALIGRGACYINIGDYQHALPDLSRVIQREPQNEIAYFDRGLAYAGQQQNQKAIDDYTEVIKHRPKWPSTWYNRGIVYHAAGDFKSAIADFTEAIRLRPDYADAYANRGAARAGAGDFRQALPDLDEALRIRPDSADLLNRGVILLAMNDPAKALLDFDEAIRLSPLMGRAYSSRAEARQALGDRTGATADLRRASELGVK